LGNIAGKKKKAGTGRGRVTMHLRRKRTDSAPESGFQLRHSWWPKGGMMEMRVLRGIAWKGRRPPGLMEGWENAADT